MVQIRGTVWSPEERAAARLSMTARPMLRIVAARGGASTERLEPAPAASGSAGVPARFGPGSAPAPARFGPVSAGASGSVQEKRYPVLQLRFQFQVGAAKPAVRPLTVAMPDRP